MDLPGITSGFAPAPQNGAPPSQGSPSAAVPAPTQPQPTPQPAYQPQYQPQQPAPQYPPQGYQQPAPQQGYQPPPGQYPQQVPQQPNQQPSAAPAAGQQPSAAGVAAWLQSQGLNVRDEAHAAEVFRQLAQEVQTARALAPHAQQYLRHASDFERWRAEQDEAAAQAQVPAAPAAPKWQVPEFDQRWMRMVELDEQTGAFRALPHVNPVVADKVNAYQAWREQAGDRFLREPDKIIRELSEDWVRETVQQQVQQIISQRDMEQRSQQFFDTNRQLLLQPDGQSLTPVGEAVVHHANRMRAAGMTDPRAIQEYAMQAAQADVSSGRVPAPPQYGQPGQQPQQPDPNQPQRQLPPRDEDTGRFLRAPANSQEVNDALIRDYTAYQSGDRLGGNGYAPPPTASVQGVLRNVPQNRSQSVHEIAREQARLLGITLDAEE